jgi:hypothetical protein
LIVAFNFETLDEQTRRFMLEEVERDIGANNLYISPRLSPQGVADYPALLRQAATTGDETTLAAILRGSGRLNRALERRKPSGGFTTAAMPVNAPETLAEGEFNRFYIRGLCVRALSMGIQELIIYRAKDVTNPRPESEAKVGTRINAQSLLDDLKISPGVEPALGLPPGPNSGLSVRFP